ncbi:MAG: ribonuclease R [Candidatus Izemoplasma sp.]|nr:ribonuclease R [Candidatus Izemoplasma sp.]
MKERIINALESYQEEPVGIDILKAKMNITDSDEIVTFMKTLNGLIEDARVIESNQNNVQLIEYTNYMTGKLDLKEKGFGFLIPDDVKEEDVFIPADNINGAMNKDHVLVYVTDFSYGARQEGHVKKVLDRNIKTLVGVVYFKHNKPFINPDDKTIKKTVAISQKGLKNASKDDVVHAKITNYDDQGKIRVEVIDILGNKDDVGINTLSKIIQFDIDPVFPDKVIKSAKGFDEVSDADLERRKDLRNEKIVTIDGDNAKDFDDAIHVKQLDNGHFKLGVHIADVSYYVTQNSILDEEAYKRGTSVYLPDRVIPMLPEHLSNGICSLKPDIDRLTITCDMEINESGDVVKYDIYPSVIHSYARMTYTNVNKILNGDKNLTKEYNTLVDDFHLMQVIADILRRHRNKNGSVNFDTKEASFSFDQEGHVSDVYVNERGDSERIIEEFMLKANQVVAEHVFWMELPFIYRVHDKPKPEKLQRLIALSNALGYQVRGGKEISHRELQRLHNKVEGTDAEMGVNMLMLRSMQKAIYSAENIGHFGLAFKYYTHFTSPIRRYPDLIVHRLLRKYLFNKEGRIEAINHYDKAMPDIAKHSSETERNAMLLERDVNDMKKAEYMSGYIHEVFEGVITSVTPFGLYVGLENTIEGLVHISNLKDDYYHYDEKMMLLVGERTKTVHKIGEHVQVKVMKVNVKDGEIDFRLLKKR